MRARVDVGEWVDGLVEETDAMRRTREASAGEGFPHLAPASAQALGVLAEAAGARNALEVGTCLGYSTLFLARAVGATGAVTTVEADDELATRARATFRDAGVAAQVSVRVGRALDVLPSIEGPFDLVFLDADKREYPAYLDHALRVVRPGGLVVADNALWGGRVADPAATDADTEGIRAYTRRIHADPRLTSVVLPIGDGLAVSVVRGRP